MSDHAAAPERLIVTRWRCPYCPRSRSNKSVIITHMRRCWYNPAAKSCKTCSNFVPDDSDPDVGYNAPEYCDAGVDLREHREREDVGPYPLGCPKWDGLRAPR